MMDTPLYLAIGVPVVSNAIMFMLFNSMMNARFTATETAFNKRFDDMRDFWRAQLRRVEEVLDARLRRLEENRG